MSRIITVEDLDDGFIEALELFRTTAVSEDSRNGEVLRLPGITIIEYKNPINKFLLEPVREANPFFHFFESLWMLSGRRDLAPLLKYNPGMAAYSDDGQNLRGTAYGHRWRNHFRLDQLESVIKTLEQDPTNRRVVMSMWDPRDLTNQESKDLPCNLQVLFSKQTGTMNTLDMTVTNRSNDLIYGAMGSNVFHFSMLLEYVAAATDMKVGTYYQVSNNLHLYRDNPVSTKCLENKVKFNEAKHSLELSYVASLDLPGARSSEMNALLDGNSETDWRGIENKYLSKVAVPLWKAYEAFVYPREVKKRLLSGSPDLDNNEAVESLLGYVKSRFYDLALSEVSACEDPGLRIACQRWLERRLNKVTANAPQSVVEGVS